METLNTGTGDSSLTLALNSATWLVGAAVVPTCTPHAYFAGGVARKPTNEYQRSKARQQRAMASVGIVEWLLSLASKAVR